MSLADELERMASTTAPEEKYVTIKAPREHVAVIVAALRLAEAQDRTDAALAAYRFAAYRFAAYRRALEGAE